MCAPCYFWLVDDCVWKWRLCNSDDKKIHTPSLITGSQLLCDSSASTRSLFFLRCLNLLQFFFHTHWNNFMHGPIRVFRANEERKTFFPRHPFRGNSVWNFGLVCAYVCVTWFGLCFGGVAFDINTVLFFTAIHSLPLFTYDFMMDKTAYVRIRFRLTKTVI